MDAYRLLHTYLVHTCVQYIGNFQVACVAQLAQVLCNILCNVRYQRCGSVAWVPPIRQDLPRPALY